MKKIYNAPVANINVFNTADAITLSGGSENGSMMTPVEFEDLFNS